MSILVVGSVALDTIKTPFKRVKDVLGGSATYFSVSASLFGPVNLIAVVGKDFPKKHIDLLRNKGVNLEGLSVKKGSTFRWEGVYGWDFTDPRTLATHLNVFADFKPVVPPSYKKSRYVFLANINPSIQRKVLKQIQSPRIVAADTMSYWIKAGRKELTGVLKKVDIFFLNESEARELTQETSLLKAGRDIQRMGVPRVVIKKGEHGVLAFSGKNIFSAPAFLLESVFDPTGAGDTFAGGVMGYLSATRSYSETAFRTAVIYGIIMSTFAVEDFSLGSLGRITLRDVNRRLEKFKKLVKF